MRYCILLGLYIEGKKKEKFNPGTSNTQYFLHVISDKRAFTLGRGKNYSTRLIDNSTGRKKYDGYCKSTKHSFHCRISMLIFIYILVTIKDNEKGFYCFYVTFFSIEFFFNKTQLEKTAKYHNISMFNY